MRRSFSLITLTLAAVTISGCGRTNHETTETARRAVAVTTASATVVDIGERYEAGGIVTARETAVLSSRIVAPVLTVRVKAGDRVRAGDVLVTLDGRDIAAKARQAGATLTAAEQGIAQARADLAGAHAEQKLAAAWHARISALHTRNSATPQELDDAEARLASAAARAAGAEARMAQADANVIASRAGVDHATTTESFTVLRAPFNGNVTERLIDPGNLAAPGTPLVRIDSTGERRVEVRVDEARAAFVQPGDTVDVLVTRSTADEGDDVATGTVTEVARAVAADQRAFTVEVALPQIESVRTGTFARVRFRGAPRKATLVPATSLRRHGQVTSLFVVQAGLARLRLVQTGYVGPEGVELLAGLDPSEIVVNTPPASLVDGDPVATPAGAGRQGDGR